MASLGFSIYSKEDSGRKGGSGSENVLLLAIFLVENSNSKIISCIQSQEPPLLLRIHVILHFALYDSTFV